MKIMISVATDNAAFTDDPNELQNILTETVQRICEYGDRDGVIRDTNGNRVGDFRVTGK